MVRIFMLITFIIFSCSLVGQDTINSKDLQGRKQGFWRKTDAAGHLVYEGHFKDGRPAGEFRYYYPDGKVKTVSQVSMQGIRASTVSYFPNGRKMASGLYFNEKKDSTWQFFSESNGNVVSEETYKDGVINGMSKVFYPEGGLSEQHFFKQGIRDGLWEQYYLEGKLKLRGAYKAGEKHGPFKTFYTSGQLMISGQYISGHQTGTWTYYNEKGGISKREIYDNGILVKVDDSGN
jgi:antitoxin component YwqK of YwqJK toxin-antitoxin module